MSEGSQSCLEKSTRYQYRPFSESENIRLLIIHPGDIGKHINCSLSHSLLPEDLQQPRPEYEALSYAWGSDERTQEVLINGMLFPVTENLFIALQQYRFRDRSRTLWVDAVCINQDDIPERNSQVRTMDRVYRYSKRVLIWLGEEDETTEDAFRHIRLFDDISWADRGGSAPITMDENPEFFYPLLSLSALPNSAVNWGAVVNLLGRAWFTRCWVLQEACLAPIAQVSCGKNSCQYNTLTTMYRYIRDNNIIHCLAGRHRQLGLIVELRDLWDNMPDPVQFDPNFFLLDLLNLTPEYLCKDPRDRIISLMGLVPYKQRLCISADYSIPCAELYINFARNMINTDSRFMLLSCAQRDKLTSLELPSWVPDWSVGIDGGSGNSLIGKGFAAGKKLTTSVSMSDTDNILVLEGIKFDFVHHVGQAMKGNSAVGISVETLPEMMKLEEKSFDEYERIASLAFPEMSREDQLDVLSRVLVANEPFSEAYSTKDQTFRGCYDHARWVQAHIDEMMIATQKQQVLEVEVGPMGSRDMLAPMLEYSRAYSIVAIQRRIGSSRRGYLGWLPSAAAPQDIICIPCGSEVPYVLRKDGDYYKLIGECYIHGIMLGEAVEGALVVEKFMIR